MHVSTNSWSAERRRAVCVDAGAMLTWSAFVSGEPSPSAHLSARHQCGYADAWELIRASITAETIHVEVKEVLLIDLLQHIRPVLIAALECLDSDDLETYADGIDVLVEDVAAWFSDDPCARAG